jgi:hypothetical protein
MASLRPGQTTTRNARYALGSGADLPIARIVALLLMVVPIGALWVISNVSKAGPSQTAIEIANFNPKSVLADNTPHFLPTPEAAIPSDANSWPPAPPADVQAPPDAPPDATVEQVEVANTGGDGAILRSDPPGGRPVATLRDGTVLQVIEHQTLPDGSDWIHVRTLDGIEGWLFSRLVGPAG